MFGWLKRMFSGYDPAEEIQEGVKDTPEGKLWEVIAQDICPLCGSHRGFYEGPSGGMSTNIECISCGKKFNVTPMLGIAEEI